MGYDLINKTLLQRFKTDADGAYVNKGDKASDTDFGVVKVDGDTIVSNNGVITAIGGGTGGMPIQDIYLGSQVIWESIVQYTKSRVNYVTAAEDGLLPSFISNEDIPAGYRKAYRLSAVGSVDGDGEINVGFNGVPLITISSWSPDKYRITQTSEKFYSWADFPEEHCVVDTYIYPTVGLVLYADKTTTVEARVHNITVHCYLEMM